MAKLSTYTEATPVLTDYSTGVDDPGGTPSTKNYTFAAIRTLLQANLTTATITVAAANTAALVSTGYSLTGADTTPMINLAGTWNTTGIATGIKLNVTSTASNASSMLMDLQLGGLSLMKLSRTGRLYIYNSSQTHRVDCDGGNGQLSVWWSNTGYFMAGRRGASESGVTVKSDSGFHFNSTGTISSGSADVSLFRDGAGILAQRVGTAAQAFRVYNTWTDASNGSWMTLDAAKTTSNVNRIISNANGTGTKRPIAIDAYTMSGAPTATEIPAGTGGFFIDSGGNRYMAINDAGTIYKVALT